MYNTSREILEHAIAERKNSIECMGHFDPLSYEDFHHMEKLKREIFEMRSDLSN